MRLAYQFQGQTVKDPSHQGPVNAVTHHAPYLPNGKTYKLQTWYIDGGRRSASATGAITSKEYILVDLAVNLSLGHFKNS